MTHLPTGAVVTATESRSQHENRVVARERLDTLLTQSRHREEHEASNFQRQKAITEHRTFVWTAWRNEVRLPTGRKAQMHQALKGRLAKLLKQS